MKIKKQIIVQCSLSTPLSKINNKIIKIFTPRKTTSGKELVFCNKSVLHLIKVGW